VPRRPCETEVDANNAESPSGNENTESVRDMEGEPTRSRCLYCPGSDRKVPEDAVVAKPAARIGLPGNTGENGTGRDAGANDSVDPAGEQGLSGEASAIHGSRLYGDSTRGFNAPVLREMEVSPNPGDDARVRPSVTESSPESCIRCTSSACAPTAAEYEEPGLTGDSASPLTSLGISSCKHVNLWCACWVGSKWRIGMEASMYACHRDTDGNHKHTDTRAPLAHPQSTKFSPETFRAFGQTILDAHLHALRLICTQF
jgi:hypothetical protein